ncbi:MAG: hypothetical protein U9R43_10595 [Thermodesulfobacteriota bacterium]|nr:hypothetical protein [Thermodesulfobacteriota bacterium]
MVHKALGINRILDSILNRLSHLDAAYLIDDYALGRDTGVIDILLVGEIDPYHLTDLTKKPNDILRGRYAHRCFLRKSLNDWGWRCSVGHMSAFNLTI